MLFLYSSINTLRQLIGNMHGGAVGIAIEQACIRSRLDSRQEDLRQKSSELQEAEGTYELGHCIKHVDIRYLAPMSGDIVICVRDDVHSSALSDYNFSRSIGQVIKKKTGQICAEFECAWSLVE